MPTRDPYKILQGGSPSIDWTQVTPRHKVINHGDHFTADGRLVTWSSYDSKEAQHVLKYLSKHGGR